MSHRSRSRPSEPSRTAPDPREPTGAAEGPQPLSPGLYVVATPIGNLRDLTLRALETLQRVDLVACEDTRVTGKLLKAHGIATAMLSYHEHNAEARRPDIVRRVASGQAVALVSDAGTPLISDPGYKLVRAVQDADRTVTTLPGPSAATAALAVSGLPTDRFFFQGFLPAKAAARRTVLLELAALRATLVVYESPRRLAATLADMAHVLGAREAAVARELTKRFEEVRRASLAELAEAFARPPRGEIVIVVGPPSDESAAMSEAELDDRLRRALGAMTLRDAVARVTRDTGLARKTVYARAVRLKEAK